MLLLHCEGVDELLAGSRHCRVRSPGIGGKKANFDRVTLQKNPSEDTMGHQIRS